ncbi:hypothetical protein C1H46_012275 [Malus baccata]|uniref:Uncharacterized protein n=1 Tax=Malus baccata TaxID=106549 RepID=A0A540MTH5_MALBA|nr:hypothetical protein C1H46_012275 [Malus baccata]
MRSVNQYLWLNNWYQVIFLANDSIACQAIGILIYSKLGWLVWANIEYSTPLCISGTSFIVLLAALGKTVKTLSCGLTISSSKLNSALVNFNSRKDPRVFEDINKGFTAGCFLVKGFLKRITPLTYWSAPGRKRGAHGGLACCFHYSRHLYLTDACQLCPLTRLQ